MTDVVIPSRDRIALANAEAATNLDGPFERIIPSDERALELPEAGLDSGPLGAFDLVSVDGGDPAEITVESGEAFIGGSHLARDTQTTATSSSGVPETFAVGWEHDSPDGVVIQPVSEFGGRDRYLEIWEIDSNVNSTDLRQFGLATPEATARPEGGIAVGDSATVSANANGSIAIGQGATVAPDATNSIVVGSGSAVRGDRVVGIGDGLNIQVNDVFATTIRTSFNDAPNLLLPSRDTDPTNPPGGSIWYRFDLNEFRGVEGDTIVTFDTTPL